MLHLTHVQGHTVNIITVNWVDAAFMPGIHLSGSVNGSNRCMSAWMKSNMNDCELAQTLHYRSSKEHLMHRRTCTKLQLLL